ncbi:SusD/RagB family nutrient-binding outer membrane lipoprotein [Zeaxanthinibacter enoshimensis]|uniref:SusD-like starch-binding protein associating with outer membrane n=1 Tax=Zeaxanthinibacter enoshimensis TaxID=392009 RepID=A0A4R6TJK9_9FLAO|nr:SusD/RagB family nutrient-binding outer membrane lipoprotein [Zeaxanthinibacter enoshimensis]TDQ31054.1 SusD-like starch-binding protein associating with outer membrane [Zeaxanthinibacter enoshimensis]
MKNSVYILLITLLLGACDKGFEEINVNPTKPDQVSVSTKLTATQLYTSGSRYENWRANLIYSSTMIQHLATTAGYWSGDKYTWNRGYAASLIDQYYPTAVKSVEDMLLQLETEDAPAEMKAITRIMRVFIYHRLTDMYGDIPYFNGGKAVINGTLKPEYDAQSAIYADMLKELEESAAALGDGTSAFGAADIMFQGDQAKWRRFAYSMMLRLGLRLVKVDPAAAEQWATKAISGGVMESNADIAYIQHTAGPEGINKNGNGEVFSADGNPRMSETFVNVLQGDPRLPILAARRSDGSTDPADLKGLPNGLDANLLLQQTGEEDTTPYAEPNRNIITGEDAPMFFQTYAEVEFMLAEAAVRWGLAGGDPEPHYNAGVRAAMNMLELYGSAAVIDEADISAYLAANPFDSANALEQINTQYWAATFLNEYEAFANWRRTGFPVLIPVNYPGNETNGTIPRRLTYPESEQSNNAENYQAVLAAQGPDLLTTRVWWDAE